MDGAFWLNIGAFALVVLRYGCADTFPPLLGG
jgi:hypothetical protein